MPRRSHQFKKRLAAIAGVAVLFAIGTWAAVSFTHLKQARSDEIGQNHRNRIKLCVAMPNQSVTRHSTNRSACETAWQTEKLFPDGSIAGDAMICPHDVSECFVRSDA